LLLKRPEKAGDGNTEGKKGGGGWVRPSHLLIKSNDGGTGKRDRWQEKVRKAFILKEKEKEVNSRNIWGKKKSSSHIYTYNLIVEYRVLAGGEKLGRAREGLLKGKGRGTAGKSAYPSYIPCEKGIRCKRKKRVSGDIKENGRSKMGGSVVKGASIRSLKKGY